MNSYISAIFSFFLTYFSLKISIPFLKRYFIDKPNQRSSHKIAKPTGGGIFFVSIGSLFCFFSGNIIPTYCIPLSLVGIFDDLYDLPPFLRYLAQLFTVLFLFSSVSENNFLQPTITYFNFFIIYFFMIIFATAIINFTNFMDGIDGLVGGCFIVIFLSSMIINDSTIFPLVGSLLGFLILNWNPSKVFMGDSGSTFLGALLLGLILDSGNIKNTIALIMISSPLLIDAGICVFRRFFNGQNIFKAHKSHLYQRLIQSGWSHARVSLLYILSTIFLSLSYFFLGLIGLLLISLILLLFGIYLDLYIAVPFRISFEKN